MTAHYKTYSDSELLKLLNRGDERAFQEIYDRYASSLFQKSYNILRHRAGAEDVVQEIFLSLWKRRAEVDIQSLPAYLNRSAWYFALRMYRDKKHEAEFYQRLANVSEEISREDTLLFKELQAVIEKVLAGLPADQQAIFQFSREQNMKYQAIAGHLNISVKTVEKKMSNTLKRIRLEVGNLMLIATLLLLGQS